MLPLVSTSSSRTKRPSAASARDMLESDVADDQRDVIGAALGLERLFARVVGRCDEEHHAEQDERRDQAAGRRTAAPPVEAQLRPRRRHHGVSLDP